MSTIYLSLPVPNPYHYVNGHRTSWAQITYFTYNAIHQMFPNNVKYLPYGENVPLEKDDILISCIPNDQLSKNPSRSIIIDNDNFEVSKWKSGIFGKYNINAQTDHTWQFNNFLKGLYGAIFKTNDIAIRKWNSDNLDVLEKKQFLLSNIKRVDIVPHPIDKDFFKELYNPSFRIEKLRMLIYHSGWRKNATELIDMLKKNNFDSDSYSIVSSVNKEDTNYVKLILKEYSYLAHISYSEGFPYFANEFLCQGLVLFGHEEWWDPYGYDQLKWTYDPERQDINLKNLRQLLSPGFKEEYFKVRRNIVQSHLDRQDNNWSYLTNKLVSMVQELLDSNGQ